MDTRALKQEKKKHHKGTSKQGPLGKSHFRFSSNSSSMNKVHCLKEALYKEYEINVHFKLITLIFYYYKMIHLFLKFLSFLILNLN